MRDPLVGKVTIEGNAADGGIRPGRQCRLIDLKTYLKAFEGERVRVTIECLPKATAIASRQP